MHYINKVSMVLGNFSFSSVYAGLGCYWALIIKSWKAMGLREAAKPAALYNTVQ